MRNEIKKEIFDYINQAGKATVKELVERFPIERRMVQYHLKSLVKSGKIRKEGKVPRVYYLPIKQAFESSLLSDELAENWLTITNDGQLLEGEVGFEYWCRGRNRDPQKTLPNYLEVRAKYESMRQNGLLEVTNKFVETFEKSVLEKVFYGDVFAYEIFGKTKWGQLVWHAKLAENKKLMEQVFTWIEPLIRRCVIDEKIDAVAFVPHSLPRRVPFLPNLRKFLKLDLPLIDLIKVTGDIPIAQKTLKRAEDRIENAQQTIFVEDPTPRSYKRVLLIDDAVGSGATLQETAKKIKHHKIAQKVYGFALVGSIKGFEVMTEV